MPPQPLTCLSAVALLLIPHSLSAQRSRPSSWTSGEAGARVGCSVARARGSSVCGEMDWERQRARDAEINRRAAQERRERTEAESKARAQKQSGYTPPN